MFSPSLREQIKCRWREFLREPSAFFWVIFMPLLWMVILGFSFSQSKPEVYGVALLDDSNQYQEWEQFLSENPQVDLRRGSTDLFDRLIKRGEIQLIVIPHDSGFIFRFDPSNPVAVRAKEKVNDMIQKWGGRTDPVSYTTQKIAAKGSRYVDFLIPGLLGLSVMTSSLFGVAMTLVSNRRENLLKRYKVTPMKSYEYIVSHIFGRYFVLATEFAAVMLGGYLLFDFEILGRFIDYLVLTMFGAAAFTAIAMVCGSRSRSIPAVSGITNIISMPMMMLSGVFFSINNFPDWMQHAVRYLPLTALIDGLRKIALEGQGLLQLQFEIAVLLLYAVVGSAIATKIFKWY